MKWIKENFHFLIVVGIIILIMSLGYYYLYALPALNRDKLNFEKEKYEENIKIEAIKIEKGNAIDDQKLNLEQEKLEFQKQDKLSEQQQKENLINNLKNCLDRAEYVIGAVFNDQISFKIIECQDKYNFIEENKSSITTDQYESLTNEYGSCANLTGALMKDKDKKLLEEKDSCYKLYN